MCVRVYVCARVCVCSPIIMICTTGTPDFLIGQDVSSFSVQLAQWCHLFKLPPPTYQYIPQPVSSRHHTWQLAVSLNDGERRLCVDESLDMCRWA